LFLSGEFLRRGRPSWSRCSTARRSRIGKGIKKPFASRTARSWGGSSRKKSRTTCFLASTKEYKNFELRLKFKIIGDDKANAGIQFRSRRIPNHHEMIGYQADLGNGYWGALYDESRRKKLLAGQDKQEDVLKVLKRGEWNDYRIRAEGKHIQLWINGVQSVDYTEPDDAIEQNGFIALQIHSGNPTEAGTRIS
jgi:hypothetical protein